MATIITTQLKTRLRRNTTALFLATAITFFPVAGFAAAHAKTQPMIQLVSGANQFTSYMSAFQAPLVVSVTDPITQRALEGVSVTFESSIGIELNTRLATTDSRGLASVTVTGLAIGTYSVKAELSRYPNTSVVFDHLQVDKAVLTIVPGDHFSSVGTVPAMADYTIQGFVHGETAKTAQVTGTPILTTAATSSSPDANYAIKGGVGSLSAPNYRFVAGFGTLVLVGGPKSETAQSTKFYDSDGVPISSSSATDSANAVRRAFLEQPGYDQPASTQPALRGSAATSGSLQVTKALSQASEIQGSATTGEVKALAILKRPANIDSVRDSAALGQVKAIVKLKNQDGQVSAGNRSTVAVRGALNKQAGTVTQPPASTAVSVKAVTALSNQTDQSSADQNSQASHPMQAAIRSAFLPSTH